MLNAAENETILYLVRHGATDANLQRPYILQGRTLNGPLSEIGRKQAAAVGGFLADYPLDAVFSSPMKRAVETAEQIATPHGHSIETIEDVAEVDVGDWESKSWDVIMQEDPELYERFMANPAEVPYKNGESYSDVAQRVIPAIRKVMEDNFGKTIALVAHNVVNRSLLATLLGLHLNKAKDIKQSNCGINILRLKGDEFSIIGMNAIFHLQDIS